MKIVHSEQNPGPSAEPNSFRGERGTAFFLSFLSLFPTLWRGPRVGENRAQSAPEKVPPLKCEPYEGLFVTNRGDKGLTTDISRSVQSKICEATMPHVCMRTHVGQHLLRKECVKGQEEISLATACGFCGNCVTCSNQHLMRNKRTHALVTLMLCDCPSQPAKLRWNTLAKKSASSPCTNHPVRCPLCTKTVWSYSMA